MARRAALARAGFLADLAAVRFGTGRFAADLAAVRFDTARFAVDLRADVAFGLAAAGRLAAVLAPARSGFAFATARFGLAELRTFDGFDLDDGRDRAAGFFDAWVIFPPADT